MKRLVCAAALLLLASALYAQTTDSHVVTINVVEAAWVDVDDAQVDIVITPSGTTPTEVSALSQLDWGTNGGVGSPYHIDVADQVTDAGTNLVQDYDLFVQPGAVTLVNGNAAGQGTPVGARVQLIDGALAQTIVSDIYTAQAFCALTYTGRADMNDPAGETEVHTVTYTIASP